VCWRWWAKDLGLKEEGGLSACQLMERRGKGEAFGGKRAYSEQIFEEVF